MVTSNHRVLFASILRMCSTRGSTRCITRLYKMIVLLKRCWRSRRNKSKRRNELSHLWFSYRAGSSWWVLSCLSRYLFSSWLSACVCLVDIREWVAEKLHQLESGTVNKCFVTKSPSHIFLSTSSCGQFSEVQSYDLVYHLQTCYELCRILMKYKRPDPERVRNTWAYRANMRG